MAILTLDQWIASSKQTAQFSKTVARTSVALNPFSIFDLAGAPGAGVLAGTSTTAGVVPTDSTNGMVMIDFTTGTGYLSRVDYSSTVACRLYLFDMLFKAGAYSYAAATTNLTAQPSFSNRCPDYTGGSTFGNGNQIWIEVSTAFLIGTAWQVQVTYTNAGGVAGRTTVISPTTNAASLTLGKMFQLPLQAGDNGVQKIESVIVTNGGTAMTAGAFNVLVLRNLWTNRVTVANGGGTDTMLATGLPIVYTDSALFAVVQPDSTSTGVPNIVMEIASA